jgi:3-hydroxymyristoyl/3-hydroxydecanoyl-(acyl carrier protein) dehydratase
MIATKENITRYIPQRDPIVMVHNLVEASDTMAVTEFYVASDNVFTYEGHLQEPGMVENIAQTAAVYIGYQFLQKNLPIPIGYIAAIQELKIESLPPVNKTLTTKVKVTNRILDVTVVQGTVEVDGKILCSCEMKVFAKNQTS